LNIPSSLKGKPIYEDPTLVIVEKNLQAIARVKDQFSSPKKKMVRESESIKKSRVVEGPGVSTISAHKKPSIFMDAITIKDSYKKKKKPSLEAPLMDLDTIEEQEELNVV
jgi:hypothetical protein